MILTWDAYSLQDHALKVHEGFIDSSLRLINEVAMAGGFETNITGTRQELFALKVKIDRLNAATKTKFGMDILSVSNKVTYTISWHNY